MTDKRFRHMPVVEGGELVGIVTIGDVVKARMTELAMEKDALEDMIMGYKVLQLVPSYCCVATPND